MITIDILIKEQWKVALHYLRQNTPNGCHKKELFASVMSSHGKFMEITETGKSWIVKTNNYSKMEITIQTSSHEFSQKSCRWEYNQYVNQPFRKSYIYICQRFQDSETLLSTTVTCCPEQTMQLLSHGSPVRKCCKFKDCSYRISTHIVIKTTCQSQLNVRHDKFYKTGGRTITNGKKSRIARNMVRNRSRRQLSFTGCRTLVPTTTVFVCGTSWSIGSCNATVLTIAVTSRWV